MRKHTFGDAELREVITTWPEFALLDISSTGIGKPIRNGDWDTSACSRTSHSSRSATCMT